MVVTIVFFRTTGKGQKDSHYKDRSSEIKLFTFNVTCSILYVTLFFERREVMRLWPVSMIPFLPNKQLGGQWKEISAMAGSIAKHGTPNHLLVNKMMIFSQRDFELYARLVQRERLNRGFKACCKVLSKVELLDPDLFADRNLMKSTIYEGWHDDIRYIAQCYYNLQEKYDCGGIPEKEWSEVQHYYDNVSRRGGQN